MHPQDLLHGYELPFLPARPLDQVEFDADETFRERARFSMHVTCLLLDGPCRLLEVRSSRAQPFE